MSKARENAIKRLRTNEALEEELEQANKTTGDRREALQAQYDAIKHHPEECNCYFCNPII
jgi:hypothetical protein